MTTTRTTLFALTTCCAALALAGCGSDSPTTGSSTSSAASSSAPSSAGTTTSGSAGASGSSGMPAPNGKTFSGAGLEISNVWVKAVPDLSKGAMTGIFGTIKNTSGKEVTVASGTQDQSARTELHETAMVNGAMQMRPVSGGYRIPAGGSFELKPGGNHIMIMNMTKPLPAGTTAKVTLRTADGQQLAFDAVAWAFPGGGSEPYASTTGGTGSAGGMGTSAGTASTSK